LAVIASNFGVIPTRPAARVRRFFVRLGRCDLRTHLSRATRSLVHMLSADPIIDQYRARETRWRFDRVLVDYDSALRALRVDIDGLHRALGQL